MMPRRVQTYLFAMARDDDDITPASTWLAVSAAWYHIYMTPGGRIPKDRFMHYAVDKGIVFG